MSPKNRRSLLQLPIFAGATILFFTVQRAGRHEGWFWLSFGLLIGASVVLFRQRASLRSLFVIPLCAISLLASSYFAVRNGEDSALSLLFIFLWLFGLLGGALVEMFWSPRADDADETDYRAHRRE